MSVSLRKKLRLLTGMKVLLINAPLDHLEFINQDNGALTGNTKLKDFEQIHWFVRTRKEVEAGAEKIKKLLTGDIICWVLFPKGSSGLQTDLTRDVGWNAIMDGDNFQWLTLVSFDSIWSAFSIRRAAASSKAKSSNDGSSRTTTSNPVAPKIREIMDYIDPVKRTIRIPDELQAAFRTDKKAAEVFDKLAFSHRKEYVEWIVTAKREETRKARIIGTLEKLNLGWKNPRNL